MAPCQARPKIAMKMSVPECLPLSSAALAAAPALKFRTQQAAWRPERAIELVAPAGPGGLNDLMMRSMQNVMQTMKLVDVPLSVSNKGGAGGALALTYLSQHQGDPHYLTLSTVNMLGNHITGQGTLNYTDFTPLGHLMHTYIAFAVNRIPPWRAAKSCSRA